MPTRQHGVVVTFINTLDELRDCVSRGGYDAVKVVSGWGISGGWSNARRAELAALVPNLIVRTVTGDPSAGGHDPANRIPDPDRTEQELAPWYATRPDLLFEIGNEPNIDDHPSDEFITEYCAGLARCIERARARFPQAQLIAPGLIVGPAKGFERFNELGHAIFRRCDLIGLHAYEFFGFNHEGPASTNQLQTALAVARQYYADMPWYLTEYGINDTNQTTRETKGERYAGMTYFGESGPQLPRNVRGMVYYHLAMANDLDQAYQIYPAGDVAFSQRAAQSFNPALELTPFDPGLWIGIILADLTKPPFSVSEQPRDN